MPTVVLVGTFDTKGEEYAFLRDRVAESKCEIVMINAGVLGDAGYPVEFDRSAVATAAGADLDVVAGTGDRGAAVTIMAEGAAAIVRGLYETGRLHGILGMGGSGGSFIISRAMRELPIGVPKLLVSTMASGDIRAFVGTSDMAMMSSVVDIAGINQISSRILGNAAAGIAAMARVHEERGSERSGRPLVAATMYGTTTPCVDRARLWLDEAGYEVLVFHATGAGGRSMESLMKSGLIDASLDITTAELAAEVAGGSLTAGPDRLEVAGSLGLPQVVSLGGVDQIAITPPEAMPAEWGDRDTYEHNPAITLVRANPDEARRLGRLIARKLNAASGPVTLFVPLRGTSSYAVEGGVFHDPDADLALFESLREHLGPSVEVVEMDTDINDPEFAVAMATRLDEHYRRVLADGDSGF
jgi:uncharacterized protein (UPF0261 family)